MGYLKQWSTAYGCNFLGGAGSGTFCGMYGEKYSIDEGWGGGEYYDGVGFRDDNGECPDSWQDGDGSNYGIPVFVEREVMKDY